MTSQTSDVEILVHVTAPSRVADDATYRSLANAYLAFQPTTRSSVAAPTIPCSPVQAPSAHATRAPQQQRQPQWDHKQAFTGSFYSDSQDISFESVLDNRSSPRLRARAQQPATPSPTKTRSGNSQANRQLPSQIADSYPMPDTDVFNVTPTRVLQRYLGSHARASTSPASASEVTPRPAREITITSSLPTSDTTNPKSSPENPRTRTGTVIPVTPLAPTSTTLKRKEPPQDQDYDTTHISSSAHSNPSTASLCRAESDPLPSKRPKLDGVNSLLSLARSSSDSCATATTTTTNPPPNSQLQRPQPPLLPSQTTLTSLEIRPPSPEVSIASLHPDDLISPKLAKLAQDLSSRYRPQPATSTATAAARTLEPLERGYWLIDCSTWTDETRIDTWSFLTNYLRSGLAGWGVWCRRSEDWRRIKLFGWAHVAKHTYLLLYLASGRAVKATGARWVDADGETRLVVGPG